MNATPTNRYGFPLVVCRRCAGSGQFGPASVHNGQCFDCGGTGMRVKGGKASKAWAAFLDAHRKFRTPTAEAVQVGDRIRVRKGDELRTVAAIEWTLQVGRSSGASSEGVVGGSGYWRTYSRLAVDVEFTFEDGSTSTIPVGFCIESRAGRVDPAPFLEGIR